MSGIKINDHASFAGKGGKYPLPEGNKMKSFSSAEGAGHLGSKYHDTSEEIHSDQMKGDSKAKSLPMKTGYRY
jgi:hypothetical protein